LLLFPSAAGSASLPRATGSFRSESDPDSGFGTSWAFSAGAFGFLPRLAGTVMEALGGGFWVVAAWAAFVEVSAGFETEAARILVRCYSPEPQLRLTLGILGRSSSFPRRHILLPGGCRSSSRSLGWSATSLDRKLLFYRGRACGLSAR
jgi:hypothetical protein